MNSHRRSHCTVVIASVVLLVAGAVRPVQAQAQSAVPEASMSPARATTLSVDAFWEPRSHWAQEGYGTECAATTAADGKRSFQVHAPGRCAVWWRPLDQPVDIASFPLVKLRLHGRGVSRDSQGFLVSLLLANSKDGTRKMRGIVAPEQVLGGKPWEPSTVDLRTLGEFDSVLGIKVELWAAPRGVSPTVLAMRPIAFLADGAKASADGITPVESIQFAVRAPDGTPVPSCRVTIDHENLNAAVSATTDGNGQATLQPKSYFTNHTATINAAGYLPLELTGLDPKEVNEVRLVPALAVKGQLLHQGQPIPGVVHFDTKTARAMIGRFPRSVCTTAGQDGQWQAEVPASAMAWLVRIGSAGCQTATCEITEANVVTTQLASVDLFPGNDPGAWQAPTPAWLLREGDNDAVVSMASDLAESKRWRSRAMDTFAAMALDNPDAARYYTLDLAWVASDPTESAYADQAVDCLLAILRRAGTQPGQAASHLRELAGGTLPAPLRRRLEVRMDAWGKVVGGVQPESEAQPEGGMTKAEMLAANLPSRTTTGGGGVTFGRTTSGSEDKDGEANAFSFGGRSKLSGSIDFGGPAKSTKENGNQAAARGSFDFGSSRRGRTGSAQFGGNRTADVQAAKLAEPSRAVPGSVGLRQAATGETSGSFRVSGSRTAVASTSLGSPSTGTRTGGASFAAPRPSTGFTISLPLLNRPGNQSTAFAVNSPRTSGGTALASLPRQTTGGAVAAVATRADRDVRSTTFPSTSRRTTGSANLTGTTSDARNVHSATFSGSSRRTTGGTTLVMARSGTSSVALGSRPASAPNSISTPWRSDRGRHTLELDFTSLADQRTSAVETTIVRNQWEKVAALVQQGKHAEARVEALNIAAHLTSQNAILTFLPLLALTDTDPAKADRNAVSDCLDKIGKTNPKATASAYAAGMLHCYRRGDFDTAQEFHVRYRNEFPSAKPDSTLLLALSLCQIKRGKQDEAYSHLATVVNDFPATDEAPRAALLLGWIDLSRQKYTDARSHLDHLVRTYPTNPCAIKAKRILTQLPEGNE